MSDLSKINNLVFEMQHDGELTESQWQKLDKIYKLSLPPQLDENQQGMLSKLKSHYRIRGDSAEWAIYDLLTDYDYEDGDFTNNDLFIVLDSFKNWALEQEEQK